MAEIELVIKIPEEIYQHYKNVWQKRRGSVPESCIAFGTLLPKGHGRLVDADSVYNILRPIEQSDAEWGMTAETAKRLIYGAFDKAPTIIASDKVESEEKS